MAAADVHATCESQPAIDHENLAVVAEIGIVQPARNQRRQKGVEVNFVPAEKSLPTFTLLEKIAGQLDSNSEMESLLRALRGEYVKPGPGADIVQNPLILPTGRNTHAVNPYSLDACSPVTKPFFKSRSTSMRGRAAGSP